MKQNSSILFHSMRQVIQNICTRCVIAIVVTFLHLVTCAASAEPPEYLDSFNPAKGFKPAQRDLTEIFLQLASSLETYGSPEPYLRHVAAEHIRIDALYRQKFGKAPRSFRPAYMTDEYLNKLSANWKLLSPKLGLDPWARDFGRSMRNAIKGTRGTGTTIVDILNNHQTKVFDAVAGKIVKDADFESLRVVLTNRLELTHKPIDYRNYDVAQRDAISFSRDIQGITTKLFTQIDQGLKPEAAAAVKSVLMSAIMDTGLMAESELQVAIEEWAMSRSSTAGR